MNAGSDIEALKARLLADKPGLPKRLSAATLQNHHSVPEYLLRMLIKDAHESWSVAEIDAEVACAHCGREITGDRKTKRTMSGEQHY